MLFFNMQMRRKLAIIRLFYFYVHFRAVCLKFKRSIKMSFQNISSGLVILVC